MERGDKRAKPRMPWPDVQPEPSRVPNPTNRPAMPSQGSDVSIRTAGHAPNIVRKRSGPRSRPMTKATFVTSRASMPLNTPPPIPLMPAIRPLRTSSSTAERPINSPPASEGRKDSIDLPSCHFATRLDTGEHGSLGELLVSHRRWWGRDGGLGVRHLSTENPVEGCDQGDRSLIRNPVENLLGLAARLDDAALAQLGELLRQAWLAKTEIGLEIADRAFALNQRAGDHEPIRIGEALHERAGSLRPLARDLGVAFLWLAHDHPQVAPARASSGNLR